MNLCNSFGGMACHVESFWNLSKRLFGGQVFFASVHTRDWICVFGPCCMKCTSELGKFFLVESDVTWRALRHEYHKRIFLTLTEFLKNESTNTSVFLNEITYR